MSPHTNRMPGVPSCASIPAAPGSHCSLGFLFPWRVDVKEFTGKPRLIMKSQNEVAERKCWHSDCEGRARRGGAAGDISADTPGALPSPARTVGGQ